MLRDNHLSGDHCQGTPIRSGELQAERSVVLHNDLRQPAINKEQLSIDRRDAWIKDEVAISELDVFNTEGLAI